MYMTEGEEQALLIKSYISSKIIQIRKNKNEKFRIGRFHHSAVPVLTNRINSRSIPRTKGTKNGTILIGRSRNRAAAKTRTVH